jgi:hypothetical protein
MGQSYRIRTELGVNKTINLELDQDFEFLEILSLKIQQSDIFTRNCADYGVTVGRVTANNGFGLPNARISVFIPVEPVDESNPIISSIYPYKSPTDKNSDGYRYNLLPYEKSYSVHAATGTLPSRTDALTGSTTVELYDKYYKFTTKTNESGDYMIMGVPLGVQTMVMDVDLSDIGEFSLTPNDLIRMGRASEGQVAGNRFKTSTDLNSLPQIISLVKQVEVSPLWGDPETCQIAVCRLDFDLRDDANIDIQPTSVFMGSMYSTSDNYRLRSENFFGITTSPRPRDNMGNLCNLVAGPGQVLAIRQTIRQDSNGNPILEEYQLEQGGNIIDGNGVWLTELPMNLDYIVTNEFGEKILSNDPAVGIPTKAKYRFKIKWTQPNSLTEQVRRPYYLVPNVREYGWTSSTSDPSNSGASSRDKARQRSSYYFGLDWTGYTEGFIGTEAINLLNEKIDGQDTFYQFDFNKVYTVAGFIDEFKNGAKGRFIGIKEIDDDDCTSSINKFPVNDGFRNFDLLYFVFAIIIQVIQLIGIPLLIIYHFLAFLWNNFAVALVIFLIGYFGKLGVQNALLAIAAGANIVPQIALAIKFGLISAFYFALAIFIGIKFKDIVSYKFGRIKLPMIQYPDCQACECVPETTQQGGDDATEVPPSEGFLSQLSNPNLYLDNITAYQAKLPFEYGTKQNGRFLYFPNNGVVGEDEDAEDYNTVIGLAKSNAVAGYADKSNNPLLFKINRSNSISEPNGKKIFAVGLSLPPGERINIFNTRKKYFDEENKIKVTFNSPGNISTHHFDNTLTVLSPYSLNAGDLLTFVSPSKTKDVNYLWTGQTSLGGVVVNGIVGKLNLHGGPINVNYATRQTGPATTVVYNLPQVQADCVDSVTIDVISAGTVSYSNCYNDFVELTANTTGSRTITNSSGVTINSLGGTAVYNLIASGDSVQRYIYPSDLEYYQVLTAITITTTVVNGQTQYTNPNFNGEKGFWGALNCPNVFDTWSEIDGQGWYPLGPAQQLPTSMFNEFSSQQVVILQRGVDPYSPQYINKYGIGKILGYANEDDVVITASTRLNIPIQPIQSGGASVQNHGNQNNIFYNNYLYTPGNPGGTFINGTAWNQFSTENVGYYGALDSTINNALKTNFPFDNTTAVAAKTAGLAYGGNRYYNSTLTTNPNDNYSVSEDLSGGAVMVGDYISRSFSLYWYLNGQFIFNRYYGYPKQEYYSPNLFPRFTGTSQVQITNSSKLVMRTDRLPSSDFTDNVNGWTGNVSLLQQNLGFGVYALSSGGESFTSAGFSTGADQVSPDISGQVASLNVTQTLNTCSKMVGLTCYSGNNVDFIVKPGCQASDVVENGCYVMMNNPLRDLLKDIETFGEWGFRFRFFYGLCRGVLSQSFVNNWVNGSLYAFPIQVDTYFDNKNQPMTPQYPTSVVYFESKTNNFYYRSSPYLATSNTFCGRPVTGLVAPVNRRNLLYPTTIVNLGIKDDFYQEIIFDPSAKGYIMKTLNSTSYSDTSDLVNLFVISRITDESFLQQILSLNSNNNLNQLFTRPEKRIDGDLAQMMSINSEYGVIPFSPEFYPSDGRNNSPVKIYGSKTVKPTMAIYYSSTTIDLQNKDFLSPGVIDFRPQNNRNAITYPYGIKSQMVPFYQWELKPQNLTGVFGSEKNSWKTNYSSDIRTTGIFSYNYQSLNRRNINTPTYMINSSLANVSDTFARGYIFNVSANTVNVGETLDNLNYAYISTGGTYSSNFLVGAPNHFYFGIIKGESALDKFKQKYSVDE